MDPVLGIAAGLIASLLYLWARRDDKGDGKEAPKRTSALPLVETYIHQLQDLRDQAERAHQRMELQHIEMRRRMNRMNHEFDELQSEVRNETRTGEGSLGPH